MSEPSTELERVPDPVELSRAQTAALPEQWREAADTAVVTIDAMLEQLVDLCRAHDTDIDGLTRARAILLWIKRLAAQAERDVDQLQVRAMPGRKHVVEGIGLVEVKTDARWTGWDLEHIVAWCAEQARLDPDTGELSDEREAGARAALELFTKLAKPEWRITAARDVGYPYEDAGVERVVGNERMKMPRLPGS